MTPKQRLAAHMAERHSRVELPNRATFADLQRVHGRQHHRYHCDHYHAGPNTGPSQRPDGWYTGEDAVMRTNKLAAGHVRS